MNSPTLVCATVPILISDLGLQERGFLPSYGDIPGNLAGTEGGESLSACVQNGMLYALHDYYHQTSFIFDSCTAHSADISTLYLQKVSVLSDTSTKRTTRPHPCAESLPGRCARTWRSFSPPANVGRARPVVRALQASEPPLRTASPPPYVAAASDYKGFSRSICIPCPPCPLLLSSLSQHAIFPSSHVLRQCTVRLGSLIHWFYNQRRVRLIGYSFRIFQRF